MYMYLIIKLLKLTEENLINKYKRKLLMIFFFLKNVYFKNRRVKVTNKRMKRKLTYGETTLKIYVFDNCFMSFGLPCPPPGIIISFRIKYEE